VFGLNEDAKTGWENWLFFKRSPSF